MKKPRISTRTFLVLCPLLGVVAVPWEWRKCQACQEENRLARIDETTVEFRDSSGKSRAEYKISKPLVVVVNPSTPSCVVKIRLKNATVTQCIASELKGVNVGILDAPACKGEYSAEVYIRGEKVATRSIKFK